jgi:hypothetical protein
MPAACERGKAAKAVPTRHNGSPLKGAGLEPSVPQSRKGDSVGEGEAGKGHGDDKRRFRDGEDLSGTEGSNPSPSSKESANFRSLSGRRMDMRTGPAPPNAIRADTGTSTGRLISEYTSRAFEDDWIRWFLTMDA